MGEQRADWKMTSDVQKYEESIRKALKQGRQWWEFWLMDKHFGGIRDEDWKWEEQAPKRGPFRDLWGLFQMWEEGSGVWEYLKARSQVLCSVGFTRNINSLDLLIPLTFWWWSNTMLSWDLLVNKLIARGDIGSKFKYMINDVDASWKAGRIKMANEGIYHDDWTS